MDRCLVIVTINLHPLPLKGWECVCVWGGGGGGGGGHEKSYPVLIKGVSLCVHFLGPHFHDASQLPHFH